MRQLRAGKRFDRCGDAGRTCTAPMDAYATLVFTACSYRDPCVLISRFPEISSAFLELLRSKALSKGDILRT